MFTLKGFFADERIFIKLFMTITVAFIGLIVASAIYLIIFPLLGLSIHSTNSLKAAAFIQTVCIFLIPTLIMAYITSKKPLQFLSLKEKISWKNILVTTLFMITAIPVINFLIEFNSQMTLPAWMSGIENWMKEQEEARRALTEKLLTASTIRALLINIFIIAAVASVAEELFFRGLLQSYFSQWLKNPHLAIWITAFIFSTIHMQFYGFIPRLLLGAYFGYLLYWSRSIWLPIIAHFINNCLVVVFFYLKNNGYINFELQEVGLWYVVLISCLLLCGLIYWQLKTSNK